MKIYPTKLFGTILLFAGLAVCGAGLWILLSPAQYRAAAKIDLGYVSPEEKSRPGIIGDPYYDPYFIVNADTEIRTMVLTNVIPALKLDASQTARMLSSRVTITPETKTGTTWIIQVTDENPEEAMQWANAIVKSYADYGVALAKPKIAAGLQVLQNQYTNEEVQILTLQTNIIEKSKFNNLVELHKLLAAKIEELKTEKYSSVKIVSQAVIATTPISPNRFLGTTLLVIGFLFVVSGFFCWRRSFPRPF